MTDTSVATQSQGNRIRVAMIVTGFPTGKDPAMGIFNLRAAKALSHFVDIQVVHLRAWKPGRKAVEISNTEGIPVLTITAPQLPDSSIPSTITNIIAYRHFGWSRLRSVLKSCDLIHSVGADFAGVLASNWARRSGVPHVTQIVGDVRSVLGKVSRFYAISGWEEYVHGVACNSSALAESYLELYPRSKNVRAIWRGVDLARFHPCGNVAGPLADKTPVRFLYLGGFPAYRSLPYRSNTKGGETLIEAWRAAESDLPKNAASLVISGPLSNTRWLSQWRAHLRYPERVYLQGQLRPETIPAFIRASDVVLIPSLEEGLPNVAMEASACGRAVFGSKVGGIPEVIVEHETGLLLRPGDVRAWESAILAAANQELPLKAMGERGRHRIEMFFDSSKFARALLDLYKIAQADALTSLPQTNQ